jgi:cytochrome b pre-mRNA-processing protein 3
MTMTTWLSRLFTPRPDRLGELRSLWARIVELAREPGWYAKGGVADTVTGRFDCLTMVTGLVMLRMEREPELLGPSAGLTELFVADVEGQLRQRGIGDPTLGKQMGKLVGALSGRIGALREALADADPAVLEGVVARNVSVIEGADPARIAAELRVVAGQLEALSAAQVLAGEIER